MQCKARSDFYFIFLHNLPKDSQTCFSDFDFDFFDFIRTYV